eukprot:GAHX01002199.1.p1 GENE.GAHX01002199.1~~GAHX01002199.1.p1  ORF type:complete len:306 (-),score=53.35 GAHX01002199.1:624-1541(-)
MSNAKEVASISTFRRRAILTAIILTICSLLGVFGIFVYQEINKNKKPSNSPSSPPPKSQPQPLTNSSTPDLLSNAGKPAPLVDPSKKESEILNLTTDSDDKTSINSDPIKTGNETLKKPGQGIDDDHGKVDISEESNKTMTKSQNLNQGDKSAGEQKQNQLASLVGQQLAFNIKEKIKSVMSSFMENDEGSENKKLSVFEKSLKSKLYAIHSPLPNRYEENNLTQDVLQKVENSNLKSENSKLNTSWSSVHKEESKNDLSFDQHKNDNSTDVLQTGVPGNSDQTSGLDQTSNDEQELIKKPHNSR